MVKPNAIDCECCPDWDDINGCWKDCEYYCGKGGLEEDEDELDGCGGLDEN